MSEAATTRLGTMHHLRLTVTDLTKAKTFYEPLLAFLGYQLHAADDERLAWIAQTATGIPQHFILSLATEEYRHERADMARPGLHHFAFNADSRTQVDQFYELLLRQGADVQDVPKEYEYSPGYYAVYFRDPDNSKLELVHVPG